MKRILFLGDVVGKPGRDAVVTRVRGLREERALDAVVVNGENAAAGAGITRLLAEELLAAGVDALTLGDHVWDQRGFPEEIGAVERLCRPANLPSQCPGRPFLVVACGGGFRLGVFTLLGRQFMKIQAECPFRAADRMLGELAGLCDAVLVEVHAETTAEKVSLGWYLDGRAAVVVGTHTHIPTADARVLPRGTAYLTDAGMCGPYESCIGREVQPSLARFLDGIPRRSEVATGDVRLCGLVVEVDERSGAAVAVEQLILPC